MLANLYRRRTLYTGYLVLTCSSAIPGVAIADGSSSTSKSSSALPSGTPHKREVGVSEGHEAAGPRAMNFSSSPLIPSRAAPDFLQPEYAETEYFFALPEAAPIKPALPPKTKPADTTGKSVRLTTQQPPAEIIVSKFRKLRWSPQGERFTSEGPVKITYTDKTTNKTTTLTAQNVEYDAQRGFAKASGGIQLEREEGQFAGEEIEYNFKTDAGFVTRAILLSPFFRMRGDKIERKEDGSYVVENGYFTTCENQRADYQIRAGKLTVSPNRFVSAKNITFYAGGTPLISLPSYRRNLNASSASPIPRIGYNKSEGLIFRQVGTPITRPNEVLDYDLRINLRRIPSGFVTYQKDLRPTLSGTSPLSLLPTLDDPLRGFLEQLSPPTYQEYATSRYQEPSEPRTTLFAVFQNDQFVYNRVRTDLAVSRFPEFGVRWTNMLGKREEGRGKSNSTTAENDYQTPNPLDGSRLRQRQADTPFILDMSVSAGGLRELPTRATSGRLAINARLATQPILLSKNLSLRFGVTNWLNVYSQGDVYNLLSPEFDLHYLPTSTTFFSLGYRHAAAVGETPFLFDRRDVQNELRLRAQFGGPWAFGVMARYDLDRARAYDTEFAILRNLDCMQIGIGYRLRSQQFSIIFNLLPPSPNRAERRQPPLQNDTNPTTSNSVANGKMTGGKK